jgi:asparagine synthase (glutamine-hydrolysing)
VAIGGDGADELFGGYQTFGILPFWPLLKRFPGFFRNAAQVAQRMLPVTGAPHPLGTKIRRFSLGLGMPDHLAFAHWLCVFSPEETAQLLDKPGTTLFKDFVANRLTCLTDEDPVTVMCKSYFRLFLPGVLEKMDRAAMNYSLETRAPFLQRRMIEFALSLPPQFKIRLGNTKYLLRKSLSSCLPGEIVRAGKKGFLPPLADEFAGNWGAGISGTLSAACHNFGIDHKKIMTLLDDHRKRRGDHSQQLWLIYQLGLFLQNSRKSAASSPHEHRRASAP